MSTLIEKKKQDRIRERIDVKLPSPEGYIYLIYTNANKKQCYVGQSAKRDFSRLEEHMDNTYTNTGLKSKDASIPLFQQWPLKFLTFDCYFCEGNSYFGFSKRTFVEFFSKFRKKGGKRINPTNLTTNIRNTQSGIGINFDYIEDYEQNVVTIGDLLDAAEILWTCKMKLLGYEMLNKDMGGQQLVWEYQDINGDWIPITANITSVDQIIKILTSSYLSSADRQTLSSIKQKLDIGLEKMLDKNLADILVYGIKDTLQKCKNFHQEGRIHLRKVVKDVIVRILSGKMKKNLKGLSIDGEKAITEFRQYLSRVLTPYEKTFLGFIDIEEEIVVKDNIVDEFLGFLVEDIAGKLATSYVGTNKVLTEENEIKLFFYIKDELLSVKGKNGEIMKQHGKKAFTVSIDQYFSIPSIDNANSSLSYLLRVVAPPSYTVPEEEKINWTIRRFELILNRVRDSKKGLWTIANSPIAPSQFTLSDNIHDGNIAVLINKKSPNDTDTLSFKVRQEYFKWLSPLNAIILNWHNFFSNFYTMGDNRWSLTNDGNIAFLSEPVHIEGLAADPVYVGFTLSEGGQPFFTQSSLNYSKRYVIY